MNSVGSWDKEREDGPLILDLLLLFYGLQFEVVVSECLGGESRSIDPDLWPPLETPPPRRNLQDHKSTPKSYQNPYLTG